MPAGFQVWNDIGLFQVADDTFCYQLELQGTVTPVTSTDVGEYIDIVYTGTADSAPMIFIEWHDEADANLRGGVSKLTRVGNTFTWRVIAAWINGTPDPTFTYYVFDRPKVSVSGAGVETYDASGKLLFSSAKRLANIKGYAGIFTPVGGRRYAYADNFEVETTNDVQQLTDLTWQTYNTISVGDARRGMILWEEQTLAGAHPGPTIAEDVNSEGIWETLMIDVTGF